MKANELRIGNWIEGIKIENPIRIINDSIAYNYYNERFEIDGIDIKYYKPIPLTKEWLKRFGFEKINNSLTSRLYSNKVFEIMTDGVTFHFWIYDNCDGGFKLDIKHVHELQNLYFALTGEELTLK